MNLDELIGTMTESELDYWIFALKRFISSRASSSKENQPSPPR